MVSNMQTKTSIINALLMVAVVFLAPCAVDYEMISKDSNAESSEYETTNCAADGLILKEAQLLPSRHSFKRAVHRLELASKRQNLRGALLRRFFSSLVKTSKEATAPLSEVQEVEDWDICPVCLVVESNTAPLFDNGLCADCNIDEGYLSENPPGELWALARSIAFSVSIVLISFGIAWLFMPKLLSSGLFGIGLMARSKMPVEYEAFGRNAKGAWRARKHSKNTTSCVECVCDIQTGEYKVMLPSPNYAQNKPHCYGCAVENAYYINEILGGGNSQTVPTVPTPPKAQTAPPKMKLQSSEPTKKLTIDLTANNQTQTTTHNLKHEPKSKEVIAAQIVDLLDGNLGGANAQIDEGAVQNIVWKIVEHHDESTVVPRANNDYVRLNDQINHTNTKFSEIVEELREEIASSAPITPLMVQKSRKSKPVKITGLYHPQVPTVFNIITSRTDNGYPLPVWLNGEAGVGKSFCVKTINDMLLEAGEITKKQHANYGEVICFADMEASQLLGGKNYNMMQGATTWNKSGLVKAILEGGLAFVDEIDKGDNAVMTVLNGVLANKSIVDPATGKVHQMNKNCFIIAAGNTTGLSYSPAYVAAQKQDKSLIDRFSACVVHYGRSVRIMAGMCGLKTAPKEAEFSDSGEVATSEQLFEAYEKICELTAQSSVSFSYRALSHGLAMARNGWTLNAIVARWAQTVDEEMARSIANHFLIGKGDGSDLIECAMIPQSVYDGQLNVAGGA